MFCYYYISLPCLFKDIAVTGQSVLKTRPKSFQDKPELHQFRIFLLTYLLSPLRALNIQGLHRGPPFLPICCTMPQVHPWSFVYFPTDLRHVFFSLLRLPLVSLLFPFSGHGRSFSIVFLLSGRIWQLFEFSCTVLCC